MLIFKKTKTKMKNEVIFKNYKTLNNNYSDLVFFLILKNKNILILTFIYHKRYLILATNNLY
jgi:hypothetical protein